MSSNSETGADPLSDHDEPPTLLAAARLRSVGNHLTSQPGGCAFPPDWRLTQTHRRN